MRRLQRIRDRLAVLFGVRPRACNGLAPQEEMAFHVDMATEQNLRKGMSATMLDAPP